MLLMGEEGVACEGVVGTVPVVVEGFRSFLEHLTASLWADDVVSEAEVLV